MTDSNAMLHYQMTPQAKEALTVATAMVSDANDACLTSQLLLLGLLSARDSGAGLALAKYAITKSKISKELAAASYVQKRLPFIFEETSDSGYARERKRQEKKRQWLVERPVQLLSERPCDRDVQDFGCPVSQMVLDILSFADELRFQEDPTEGMDTYYLLVSISHHPESNAAVILEKLMADLPDGSPDDSLKAIFTMKEERQYRKTRDGHATQSSKYSPSLRRLPD